MKKILVTTIASLSLAACSTLGETEISALKQAGINDARQADTNMHLAFLQCYALQEVDKKFCQREAGGVNENYKHAITWDYIRPFRYEAERLGFKAFLNQQGKSCDNVNEGPQYQQKNRTYQVNCTNGNQYSMRFDYRESQWHLEE